MTGLGAAARPGGFGDWLPGAASERRVLTTALVGTFEAAGYALLDTPTVEYAATIERGLGGDAGDDLFRFMDADGSMLALVGERTVSVARTVATELRRGPFPLRLCYAGPVVRNRTLLGGRRREAMQAGCELVGDPDLGADAECVALAIAAVDAAGVPDIQVDIGHAAFLPALLAGAGVDAASRAEIGAALAARDLVAVEARARGHRAGTGRARAAAALPGAARRSRAPRPGPPGPRGAPSRCAPSMSSPGCGTCSASAASRTASTSTSAPCATGRTTPGPTFELFSGDVGFPLGAGGRYNSLLGRFGLSQPATGFVVHADRCHDAISRAARWPPPRRRPAHRRADRRAARRCLRAAPRLGRRPRPAPGVVRAPPPAHRRSP